MVCRGKEEGGGERRREKENEAARKDVGSLYRFSVMRRWPASTRKSDKDGFRVRCNAGQCFGVKSCLLD